MSETRNFGFLEVEDSPFHRESIKFVREGDDFCLTKFAANGYVEYSYNFGNIFDYFFKGFGPLKEEGEIVMEALDEVKNIMEFDADPETFLVDGEIKDFYEFCEGLTRMEVYELLDREDREEYLMNSPVD